MDLRNFEVDFDSIDSLNRLRNKLKTRLCELTGKENKSRRETKAEYETRRRNCFEAYFSILDTNITHLYSDISASLDSEPKYYVYAHLDTSKPIVDAKKARIAITFAATFGMQFHPFYIGKGVGDRAYELSRNETHKKVRDRCKKSGKDITPIILKDSLSELDALAYEAKLMDIFGSIACNGLLVNIDDGHRSKERKQLYKKHLECINSINTYLLKDV